MKQGNIEHTVVPNAALRNVGFQWLLHVFPCKESITLEFCTLIRELSYTNPHLSSPSEKKVTTLRKEQVQTCNNAVRLLMLL
jgi:hypothetical protein